jgi:superfamily II DNA or RNA helicase
MRVAVNCRRCYGLCLIRNAVEPPAALSFTCGEGVRVTTTTQAPGVALPREGSLVEVRGQRWVVSEPPVAGFDADSTLLTLQSVEDGRYGESLQVIWEVEPGRKVLPAGSLPDVTATGFDPPERLAAFLDAVRWSAVTSADVKTLQAPLRSGVTVEEYQLEPVARAIEAPRVNLLLADDVGLGKTIEAGLVALELLLRHRAKRIMVVCPPGLMVKWQDEMAEKFGLTFTIVDSAQLNTLRRSHGSAANPFRVYPLTIVSLSWLRGAKAERLLHEVIEGTSADEPPFDLLILDEAHHVAPAAPKQRYAVDSQQTKLIRWLAPHFENRLFLSATPHNGYPESFTALLEIIDDLKFARGVDPDPFAQRETVIRRMKWQITDPETGQPRFQQRNATALSVTYPAGEREAHARLAEFAALRRKRLTSKRGKAAVDLVTLLLKKRLFSSPRAFAHTVGVYLETVQARTVKRAGSPKVAAEDEVPEWLEGFFDDVAAYDDDEMAEAEDDATARSGKIQAELADATEQEIVLLRKMEAWAARYENAPDAKARELITYLTAVCRPDGKHWTNERVVVFTEYRDTQIWLKDLLAQEGMDGDQVQLLYGGMDARRREQLRLAFAEPPDQNRVRILLATDAASEGIDLHEHCYRLVNYDIPFNPNKLEQRIGRIDRYGQPKVPEVRHFIGTGWESERDTFKDDLEFLARIAVKVARMEEDLGTVNAVLADAVQRRMLGDISDFDIENASAKAKRGGNRRLSADSNVSEQVRKLRADLDDTVKELKLTPGHVKRLVDTALELDGEQPLRPAVDERQLAEGLYEVPALTKSWARATEKLYEKLEREGEEPRRRPITFDGKTAKGRHDIVLAHLGHPLVDMSARLLRAAVWSGHTGLHRVTAVVSDDPALETTLAGAYSRFVLVGKDGIRLHEEILYAGGWVRDDGTFRRLDSLSAVSGLLDRALTTGTTAAPTIHSRLAAQWGKAQSGLITAIDHRAQERLSSLTNKLKARHDAERAVITTNATRFEQGLRTKLSEADPEEDALFSVVEGRGDERELAQWRRDRDNWQRRLDDLAARRARELARVDARYAEITSHSFPVAVIFAVPKREAIR